MMIKKWINHCFEFTKSFIDKTIIKGKPLCYIAEINLTKKIVIINCRGFSAPIKLSFDKIINDYVLLSNLSSIQASWIGYYYGRYYNELKSQKQNNNTLPICDITIETSREVNTIIMLNRQGDIIYADNDNNITQTISPIQAMMRKKVIEKFAPIQACYIGILAGIKRPKKIDTKTSFHTSKARLKLVN